MTLRYAVGQEDVMQWIIYSDGGIQMLKNRKIVYGLAIAILLVCTGYIIYRLVSNPLDTSILIPAIVVTGGFYMLGSSKRKK